MNWFLHGSGLRGGWVSVYRVEKVDWLLSEVFGKVKNGMGPRAAREQDNTIFL